MKTYRKMLAVMAAFVVVTLGAFASPVYYTILHALEEGTMKVFTDGGQATPGAPIFGAPFLKVQFAIQER